MNDKENFNVKFYQMWMSSIHRTTKIISVNPSQGQPLHLYQSIWGNSLYPKHLIPNGLFQEMRFSSWCSSCETLMCLSESFLKGNWSIARRIDGVKPLEPSRSKQCKVEQDLTKRSNTLGLNSPEDSVTDLRFNDGSRSDSISRCASVTSPCP